MKNSHMVKGVLKTSVSLLFTGIIAVLLSASVTQIVPTPRGTARQLEKVRGRNWSEWPWGVGGQAADLESDSEVDSAYELTINSRSDWETKTRSQDWIHLDRGDGSHDLTRTTIVRF